MTAPTAFTPAFTTDLGALFHGDCIPWLKTLPDNSADLIFADPPFNLKKDYGPAVSDNMTEDDYLDWTKTWVDQVVRILAPGGALWIYNIPRWAIPTGAHIMTNHPEMMFRHQVAVSMKNGLPIPGKLSPAHYSALYFTKGKPKAFTRPRTPIETCRHCGREIKDYGGHRNKMNPAGVNLTDIWTDLSPVRHRKTKHRSANALPEKMLERILTISSQPGDLVIDPFGGSGTTYAVAEKLGRHWQGIELGDLEPIVARLQGSQALFAMPNLGDAGKGKS